MKNKLGLCLLLQAAIFAAPAFAGETLDRVMTNKVMIEVTDQAYPPFSFVDDKGEMVGFDIDVSREIAKRLGVGLKVETPAFQIISGGKWQGRWDICVCSMSLTKERSEVLDFVAQYYFSPAVIVTHANNVTIRKAADLTGKKTGAEAGTTYEKYLQKQLTIPGSKSVEFPFGDLFEKPYENEDAAFQDLGLGDGKRLDAIVANEITAMEHIKKTDGKFKVIGEPVFAEAIWVVNDKNDQEWNAKIKEIITDMIADGTLKTISIKWTGIDVTPKP